MSRSYQARILRVDLTEHLVSVESVDERTAREYVGGTSLGIKILHDEVPPGVEWNDAGNRLFIGSGPLGGSTIEGSGAIAVVTKGPLTNGVASSQANGFFGRYLKTAGFDAIVVHGVATEWTYLHVRGGTAELRDARHLRGSDTYSTENKIKEELRRGRREASVICIGPAGENLVRYALMLGDMGHVASHNGVGAVMGSKKLKAIVVDKGSEEIGCRDEKLLRDVGLRIKERIRENSILELFGRLGTVGLVPESRKMGILPVKNYTTGVFEIEQEALEEYGAERIRQRFEARPSPCWGCGSRHCHTIKLSRAGASGRVAEEPEYESMAAWSSLVGITDVTKSVALSNEVDLLGMDTNETGWVIAWAMECYEKGLLSEKDLDGTALRWGDHEAISVMLHKIALREGVGALLAEGVMRASRQVGKEAAELAVHTLKGNTPRSHDHRAMWYELFDTCVSNLGTLEAGSGPPLGLLGLPPYDSFDPEGVSTVVAKVKGGMVFEDSMVTCRFRTGTQLDLLAEAVNAVTGWDVDLQETLQVGRRAITLARIFNLQHGIAAELDRPSSRYGSTPSDGVAAGKGIMPHWDAMLRNYYRHMGWDEHGEPLPETLSSLGLGHVVGVLGNS